MQKFSWSQIHIPILPANYRNGIGIWVRFRVPPPPQCKWAIIANLHRLRRIPLQTRIRIPNPTLCYAEHVHIAQTRIQIPTPYFCVGVRLRQCKWAITLFIYAWRRPPKCFNSRAPERNLPVDWTISPWEERELLREEWPGELSTLLHLRDDTDLSQPNTFFGSWKTSRNGRQWWIQDFQHGLLSKNKLPINCVI